MVRLKLTHFLRGDTGSGKFTLAPDVQSTLTCCKYHDRKACVFAFENVAVYDYLRPSMKHFLSVHWIKITQLQLLQNKADGGRKLQGAPPNTVHGRVGTHIELLIFNKTIGNV